MIGALVFLVVAIRSDSSAPAPKPQPADRSSAQPRRDASEPPAPTPRRPNAPAHAPPREPSPPAADTTGDPPEPDTVTLPGLTREEELDRRRGEQASMERAIAGLRDQISSSSADDPERRQLEHQLERLERLAATRREELEQLEQTADDAP